MYTIGFLFLTLLIGSLALPAQEADMSIFFDHTDSSSSRIVGGTVARDSVPHMVALINGLLVRGLICGGSLITSRHILTAAHCIEAIYSGGTLSNSLRITVGTSRWNTGGFDYNIARNITHPNYDENTIKNDIGFLVPSRDIALSSLVQPVELNFDWIGAGVPTRVNGWGRTTTGGSISSILMELEAASVDGDECARIVARRGAELNIRGVPAVDPRLEICAFRGTNQGTCNGDSGSALLRADRRNQIGVVSWGLPCARNAPDMFVRVGAYRSWIEQSLAQ